MNEIIGLKNRVRVIGSELNPLTNYYIEEIIENDYKCIFDYEILSGIIDIPKFKVSKHPIQKSDFTFELTFNGTNIPISNDWSVYFKEVKYPSNLIRIPSFCIKEILDNIKDVSMLNKIKEIIHYSFYSDNDPIMELDDWICGSLESLDGNCNYKCLIEFTFEVPLTAVYNSEFIKDYYVTTIFLLCFIQIMLKIELTSKERVLDIIDNYKF